MRWADKALAQPSTGHFLIYDDGNPNIPMLAINHMRTSTSTFLYSLIVTFLFCVDTKAADVPVIVIKLAEQYAESHKNAASIPSGQTLVNKYASYFFSGLTHPDGGIWNAPEIETDAYNLGQSYWREHPNERDEILAGYGYVHIEAEGTWLRCFELSSFTPEYSVMAIPPFTSENWWLNSFGGTAWNKLRPGQADPTFGKSHVRIIGYLSPIGRKGHLGMYDREVLVTSFTQSYDYWSALNPLLPVINK